MEPVLFIGRSQTEPGRRLAEALGVAPAQCLIEDFADGELRIAVAEEMAGREAFVLQSTAAPAGRNLLELLLLADACRRRGARRVTAVIPYFGYARQDRRISGEEPLGGRILTDLLATRCDRIIAVDLHNPAIEGFASVPLFHLSAVPLLAEAFREYRTARHVLVAPDAGAVDLAQQYARHLQLPVAYIEKVRHTDREVAVQTVTGTVAEKAPVLVDDMISTGGTLLAAGKALLEAGARAEISILASHALLVDGAARRLAELPVQRLMTTDSVSPQEFGDLPVRRFGLAGLLADAVRRVHQP